MTPDVVVDIGNTRIKFGLCYNGRVVDGVSLNPDSVDEWAAMPTKWFLTSPKWAVASVHPDRLKAFTAWVEQRGEELFAVTHHPQLPIADKVANRESVGFDRFLNAIAARELLPPGDGAVIVDVGTASTIDWLDGDGLFRGGAILPGPRLMLESLHRYTAKLPLIDEHGVPAEYPPGRRTADAMGLGVQAANIGAVEYLVREYTILAGTQLHLVLTGGGLGSMLEHPFLGLKQIHHAPYLTLDGLRITAEFHS